MCYWDGKKMASGESVDVIPSFQLQSVSSSSSPSFFSECECRQEDGEKNPDLKSESKSESEHQQPSQKDEHEHENETKEEMLKQKRRKSKRRRRKRRSKLKRIVRRVALVDTGLALFQVLYAQFRLLRPDHLMGRDVFGQFMDQSFIFPVILILLIAFQGILAIRLYGATFLIEEVWALTEKDNENDIDNENEIDSGQQEEIERRKPEENSSPPSRLSPSEQDNVIEACLKRCRWWFRGGIFFLILSFLDTFVIIFLLTFSAYKRLATIFLLTTINLTQIIFRIASLWLVSKFMKIIVVNSYHSHLNPSPNPNTNSTTISENEKRHSLCNNI